jgi:thioredoxin-related protein
MKTFRVIAVMVLALSTPFLLSAKDKKNGKEAPLPDTDTADHVVWLTYDQASRKSKQEGEHIFIHFTTKTCGWCRKMERETYTDTAVIRTLNQDFAPVQIWADSYDEVDVDGYIISQRALAIQEFGVRSYPQYWFINPDNAKVGPLKGYLPAKSFLKALNFVKDFKYDTTRASSDTAGSGSHADK